MKNFKKEKGFTLIELLVVVAIIGLLASVILASLNTARAKGRDAKRLSDLQQIRTALAMYYIDHGGTYPLPYPSGTYWGGVTTGACGTGNGTTSGATAYISGLTPTYISVLPTDPNTDPSWSCRGYLYASNGTDYNFLIYQTVEGTVPSSLKRPSGLGEPDYDIYTSAAAGQW